MTKTTTTKTPPETTEAQTELANQAPIGDADTSDGIDTEEPRVTAFQPGDIVTSTGKDRHKILVAKGDEITIQTDVMQDGRPQGGDTETVKAAKYRLVIRP